MQLVMYAGNDFIASVSLNASKLSVPGYVGNLKRKLIEENQDLLHSATREPEFLVVNFSCPLNAQAYQHSH